MKIEKTYAEHFKLETKDFLKLIDDSIKELIPKEGFDYYVGSRISGTDPKVIRVYFNDPILKEDFTNDDGYDGYYYTINSEYSKIIKSKYSVLLEMSRLEEDYMPRAYEIINTEPEEGIDPDLQMIGKYFVIYLNVDRFFSNDIARKHFSFFDYEYDNYRVFNRKIGATMISVRGNKLFDF